MSAGKRQRAMDPTVQDVMYFGRFMMENDPFKHRAPQEEDRAFRALFGCGPEIVLVLWNKLVSNDLIPRNGQMKHLLWTLMYCKTYAKWKTMRKLTETDPKTLRKWIDLFYQSIQELSPYVVSLSLSTKQYCRQHFSLSYCFADCLGKQEKRRHLE